MNSLESYETQVKTERNAMQFTECAMICLIWQQIEKMKGLIANLMIEGQSNQKILC
jgi:hypothetical protein